MTGNEALDVAGVTGATGVDGVDGAVGVVGVVGVVEAGVLGVGVVENDVLVPVTTPLNVNEFPDVIVPITFPLVSTTLKLAPGATVTFVPADISSEGFNVNVKSPLLILTSPLNFPPLILPPE